MCRCVLYSCTTTENINFVLHYFTLLTCTLPFDEIDFQSLQLMHVFHRTANLKSCESCKKKKEP